MVKRMATNRITRWSSWVAFAVAALASWSVPAAAQDRIDRADSSMAIEDRQPSEPEPMNRPVGEAVARPQRDDVMTPLPSFVAGAVRVDGATALPRSLFASVIEPYLGRELSPSDVRALARDVGAAARRAGYGLATAWVPEQNLAGGVLRVRLEEGRIDQVEANGPAGPQVERLLRRLTGGAPVSTEMLERQLLLAGDLAGVTLGDPRMLRRNGRNVLIVETAYQRVRTRAWVDNWSSDVVGPVRARLNTDINGVLAFGDRVSVGAAVTPLQPREFQMVEAGYTLPFAGGTEATVRAAYSRSAAGGSLRDRDLDGDSLELEAGLSQPLLRSRSNSLWGHVFFSFRDSELTREGVLIRDDRIVALSGILYATKRLGGGSARARLSLVQGLDLFGATRRDDPARSRPDAGGTFSKAALWAEFTHRLGKGFSLQLSGQGQLASRPLLASEEMGLGGRAFLRGYDYREFTGDRGVAGSAELRYDLPQAPWGLQRVQLYAYGDAGTVGNLRGGSGGGTLASAGGGVRLALDPRLEFGVEAGVPLMDGFLGNRPNPPLSFYITTQF